MTRSIWFVALALLVAIALPVSHADAGIADKKRDAKEAAPTVAELADDLHDARADKRRAAVRKLAELGTKPAMELVIGALGDRDGEVGSEAQVQLARLREPGLVRDLLGRAGLGSSEDRVPVRAAESFGRMPVPIDGSALLRAARGKPDDLARTILASCERAAVGGRLVGDHDAIAKELEGVSTSRARADVRGAALFALRAFDAARARPLALDGLSAREPEMRCAALAAFADALEGEAIDLSARALLDPETSVRARAIENLCARSARAAFLALAGHLQRETRSRLVQRIHAHLVAASGEDHGLDAKAWEGWARTLAGVASTGDGPRGRVARDTKVNLAGLGLVSDRIVFLIDLSGSVWKELSDGRTRKQKIDEKLKAALESLPKETLFNLVPYTGEPFAWEKALVPATPANVQRALSFFTRCTQSGRGDYLRAARAALTDPAIDTVCALTDGVPTGGEQWNLDLIVDALLEANRFRCVAFDTILVDAHGAKRRPWERLSTASGGAVHEVELDPAKARPLDDRRRTEAR